MAKILTVSLNEEAEKLWTKVKKTGIGPSRFMREALGFYVEKGTFNLDENGKPVVVEENKNPVI
jgi:hypothetical protein